MKSLLEKLESIKSQIIQVTSGPLYKEGNETIKIKIDAPEDNAIDFNQITLVVRYSPKHNKFNTTFIIKDPNQSPEYIKDLVTHFDEIKFELADKILWLNNNFDSFLLRAYKWYERYSSVDMNGSTCMRYYLKKQIQEPQLQIEQKRKKDQILQNIKNNQQTDENEQNTQRSSQQNENVSEQCTADENQSASKTDYVENQTLQKFTIRKKNTDYAPTFKLVDQKDFITLDKWEQKVEEQKIRTEQAVQKILNGQDIDQQNNYSANVQARQWNDNDSKVYQKILFNVKQHSIISDVLQLLRYYHKNQINIQLSNANNIIFSFQYKFSQLIDNEIKSSNLQILNKYIKNPEAYITMLININLQKPWNIFIKLDQNNTITQQLKDFMKYNVSGFNIIDQDATDKNMMSHASRIITHMMRYNAEKLYDKVQADFQEKNDSTDHSETISQNPSPYIHGVEIIQPKQQRIKQNQLKESKNQPQNPQISDEEIQQLLQQLPMPYNHLIYNDKSKQYIGLSNFILRQLPQLFGSILSKAGEMSFQDRVQDYYKQQGIENDTQSDEDTCSEESSSQNDDDQSSDDESSQLSSSSDSIFDTYGQTEETFLHHIEPEQNEKDGIRLKLFGFDLSGALIVQFVRPIIMVICNKCLKITSMHLESIATKNKSGNLVNSDHIFGTETCTECNNILKITMRSMLFNQFSGGECMFMIKQQGCLPVSLGFIGEATMLTQCSNCQTIGLQSGLRELASGGYSGRCPMCFKRVVIKYENAAFLLPNGEIAPLPKNIKINQFNQNNMKTREILTKGKKTGPLPDNGTCQHAKRSFRWFRFACGGAYPCDTCHELACSCGDTIAKAQICGFCGHGSSIKAVCPRCGKSLVAKKSGHWEGGKGNRNLETLSKKDARKYVGRFKTRSNKDRKRTAMQKRGNRKKKEGEMY